MMERITQSMLATTTVYNVQANLNRMAAINESMTSGKRMKFASDDPASSVDSMRLRKHLAATEQYQRNIDDASAWMQTADSAMQSVSGRYIQAKDSLIRANSGSQGVESSKAIAADLRQQAASLMHLANSTYLGRTVFAGNSDKGAVFAARQANGETVYEQLEQDAVTAQPVNRQINSNQIVAANVDGHEVFGTGTIKWNPNKLKTTPGELKYATNEYNLDLIQVGTDYYHPVEFVSTRLVGVDREIPDPAHAGHTIIDTKNEPRNQVPTKYQILNAEGEVTGTVDSTTSGPPDLNTLNKIYFKTADPDNPDGPKINRLSGTIEYSIDDRNNPNVMNLLIEAAKMLETDGNRFNQSKMMAIQNQLSAREEKLRTEMSALGAKHKVVLENQESVVTDLNNIKSQISGVEDIDIQKSTIELSLADMAYKASLGATQRVIQPTLLDYLR